MLTHKPPITPTRLKMTVRIGLVPNWPSSQMPRNKHTPMAPMSCAPIPIYLVQARASSLGLSGNGDTRKDFIFSEIEGGGSLIDSVHRLRCPPYGT